MRRGRHQGLERDLRALRAPGETRAQQRAWPVVSAVYAQRPRARRARSRARLILIPAAISALSVVALTPAAATVHRWIERTLGVTHPRTELISLPARGHILVSGPAGTWTVAADGSRRRVGSAPHAIWSPNGRYLALASGAQLTAVTPLGMPVWSIARPALATPQWYAPNGYRIAYLSGHTLRIIAGDGTGDRPLVNRVARIAPAWQPGHAYRLAYVTAGARLVLRDADTGAIAWSRMLPSTPEAVTWSANGARLLVVMRAQALVLDGSGTLQARIPASVRPWRAGAISADGVRVALLDGATVTVSDPRQGARSAHTVFTGIGVRQLVFSPDGAWLLVSWPAADQWIFIHAVGAPRIIAVSRIAEQFGARTAQSGFPALDGWCCTRSGQAA